MLDGLLTDVELFDRGSVATVDTVAGATELPVDDLTDFSPDGGEIDVLGETYAYAAVIGEGETYIDDEGELAAQPSGRLVLTEALRGEVLESDPVLLRVGSQTATDVYAVVDLGGAAESNLDDAGDSVRVPIPYDQQAVWPVAHYDPPWPVLVADDLSEIEQVPGLTPVIDGSIIDPDTLPPAEIATDGEPPALSPTPIIQGGIGSLFISWEPVANPDRVSYAVHVIEGVTPFEPTEATLVGETGGTLLSIRALPDGTPVVAGTSYTALIAASDADGDAPASSPTTGTPAQATTPDIAVNAITADQIMANAVTAEKLESVLVLGTRIVAGDPEGARVEMNTEGFGAVNPAGETTLRFVADTGMMEIAGDLSTDLPPNPRVIVSDSWEQNEDGEFSSNTTQIRFNPGENFAGWSKSGALTHSILGSDGNDGFELDLATAIPAASGVSRGRLNIKSGSMSGTTASPALTTIYGNMRVYPWNRAEVNNDWIVWAQQESFRARNAPGQGSFVVVAAADQMRFEAGNVGGSGTGGGPKMRGDDSRVAVGYWNSSYSSGHGLAALGNGQVLQLRTTNTGAAAVAVRSGDNSGYRALTASAFNTPSDRTLKTNIRPPDESALDIFRAAPVYLYDFKLDAVRGAGREHRIGVMADDMPAWVITTTGDPEDPDGETLLIDQEQIVGLLIQAVQELDHKVNPTAEYDDPEYDEKPFRASRVARVRAIRAQIAKDKEKAT